MNKFFQYCFFSVMSLTAYAENAWTTAQASTQQVSITGFSRARHSMILSTEVEGKVKHIFTDVGDATPKDGKIVCLDPTFVNIEIKSINNQIKQYQVDIAYFSKQVSRYQDLVNKKSVSMSQLDDFKRQLANAKHSKQSSKIEKQRLAEKLKRHCIKSPSGWKMIERYVEAGQWLTSGSQIAKVADYSKLLVPLALSVNELNALQKKQHKINVWLPEFNQNLLATMERISPAFDEQSRKIQVDLQLEKDLPVYRGGIRVEVKLALPDSTDTFLISEQALDKRFEEVWLHRKNEQTLRVELLGNAENGRVRIASPDIQAGDQFKILQP